MQWQTRYEPFNNAKPWVVYLIDNEEKTKCESFETEEEARHCVRKKERHHADPLAGPNDAVEEAELESFPASDPPSWTGNT